MSGAVGKGGAKKQAKKLQVSVVYKDTLFHIPIQDDWTVVDLIENTLIRKDKSLPSSSESLESQYTLLDNNKQFEFSCDYLVRDVVQNGEMLYLEDKQ